MSYTKGPWVVVPSIVPSCRFQVEQDSDDGLGMIVSALIGDLPGGVAEEEANAHLLASAPDLLEACKEAEEAVLSTLHHLLASRGMPEEGADENPTLVKLRSAIKKAEGRS